MSGNSRGTALAGRVAVVTGAASGIGRAIVELFTAEGAQVVAGDVADRAGAELATALGDAVEFVHADVTREEEIAALVDAAVDRFGGLDIMVNNAGAGGYGGGLQEFDPVAFEATTRLLLTSVALGHKHAVRYMREQGGGSIISTASVSALQAGWAPAAYSASKAAVLSLVRHAAAELGPLGIRSNALCPGIILTPILGAAALPPDRRAEFMERLPEQLARLQPLGRAGLPEDVAQAALWLAGAGSSFVTGQAIVVDGGATAVTATDLSGSIARTIAELLAPQA